MANLHYIYGDDSEMIEKKCLPSLLQRYKGFTPLRLDATIDDIKATKLLTEYQGNDLFSPQKLFIIRNVEEQGDSVEEFLLGAVEHQQTDRAIILLGKGLNKTTRLGKLLSKTFKVQEFALPEIKPFDLLDALNTKNTSRVLLHYNKLLSVDFHPLAMYSLLCGHFFLMKQVKERQKLPVEIIARELKQHQFRIQKMTVANRYWQMEEINNTLRLLARLGDQLRSWQYDEGMLLTMFLIKITI